MRITLSYSGDVYGVKFTPIYILMLGEELANMGHVVTLEANSEEYDVAGIPADSIFSKEYQDIIADIEKLKGQPIDYTNFKVDYTWVDADVAGVLTAFGCKYKCKFCPHYAIQHISRNKEQVISELNYVTQHYKYFEFIDNNVMADKETFFEIITHIPEGVKWGALINVANYSIDDLKYLKEHGCVNIYTGIESFNKLDLEYFGKPYYSMGIDPKEFLLQLKGLGFNVYSFLIQGLPNETPEDFSDMLKWMEDNKILYAIGNFMINGEPQKLNSESPKEFKCRLIRNEAISQINFTKFMESWL